MTMEHTTITIDIFFFIPANYQNKSDQTFARSKGNFLIRFPVKS